MSQVLAGGPYQRDRSSAADLVLRDIRDQILSRRLPRGTRLPTEKELAAHYDVSTPTIREAIRALSAMNMVEARHGSGTYVTADGSALVSFALSALVELEEIDLASVFVVSGVIYSKAAEVAIVEATDDEIAGLRASAERFQQQLASDGFGTALEEFLTRFVALSHNKLLIAISTFLIESQIALARDAADRSPSAWQNIAGHLIDERIAIVDALDARDSVSAQAAVARYMARATELVREHAGS